MIQSGVLVSTTCSVGFVRLQYTQRVQVTVVRKVCSLKKFNPQKNKTWRDITFKKAECWSSTSGVLFCNYARFSMPNSCTTSFKLNVLCINWRSLLVAKDQGRLDVYLCWRSSDWPLWSAAGTSRATTLTTWMVAIQSGWCGVSVLQQFCFLWNFSFIVSVALPFCAEPQNYVSPFTARQIWVCYLYNLFGIFGYLSIMLLIQQVLKTKV